LNSAALRWPRMAILEFLEPVSEASPHETTKATSLERETKLGHPVRRPALHVALAATIKQRAGRSPAAGQEGNRLIVKTSSISNQLSSPVLRSSVSPDEFPVAGEGFPWPCAPTIVRGDGRKVLVLPTSLSDMCPLRCRNDVPGSEREGVGRIVRYSETIPAACGSFSGVGGHLAMKAASQTLPSLPAGRIPQEFAGVYVPGRVILHPIRR
jgi:hypothetical protein